MRLEVAGRADCADETLVDEEDPLPRAPTWPPVVAG
jgi:hypothetical protein